MLARPLIEASGVGEERKITPGVILSGAKDRVGGRSEPRASLACPERSFAPLRMTSELPPPPQPHAPRPHENRRRLEPENPPPPRRELGRRHPHQRASRNIAQPVLVVVDPRPADRGSHAVEPDRGPGTVDVVGEGGGDGECQ